MNALPGPTCGEPTQAGTPCQRRSFTDAGGPCDQHAHTPLTDAYRAAAKTRAERHGFFAKSFEEEEDLRDYEAAVERSSQPSVPKRAMVGLGTVRLNRMVKWELAQGKPCALTTAAYNALGRAISDLPPAAAEGHQCLDDAAIYRQVQILLKDPELFLATLPKHLAEAVRKALHETPAPTVTTHGP